MISIIYGMTSTVIQNRMQRLEGLFVSLFLANFCNLMKGLWWERRNVSFLAESYSVYISTDCNQNCVCALRVNSFSSESKHRLTCNINSVIICTSLYNQNLWLCWKYDTNQLLFKLKDYFLCRFKTLYQYFQPIAGFHLKLTSKSTKQFDLSICGIHIWSSWQ